MNRPYVKAIRLVCGGCNATTHRRTTVGWICVTNGTEVLYQADRLLGNGPWDECMPLSQGKPTCSKGHGAMKLDESADLLAVAKAAHTQRKVKVLVLPPINTVRTRARTVRL